MRGAIDRLKRDGERDVALSHTTASMTRAKALDPLHRYLPRHRRRKQQPGAMLDRLKQIAADTKELG